MNNNIIITINSISYIENELVDSSKYTYKGWILDDGTKSMICYREPETSIVTTIELLNDSMQILKTLDDIEKNNMFFKEGNEHISLYDTEYGTFEMAVTTTRLNIIKEFEKTHVELEYMLNISGSIQELKMDITIEKIGD